MKKYIMIILAIIFNVNICYAFVFNDNELIQYGNSYANMLNKNAIYNNEKTNSISSVLYRMSHMNSDLQYNVTILKNSSPNAFSIPGNNIYINYGLLKYTTSYDMMCFVIAHEMGHSENNHFKRLIMNKANEKYNYNIPDMSLNELLLNVSDINLNFDGEFEIEADNFAFKELVDCNYNIGSGAILLHRLYLNVNIFKSNLTLLRIQNQVNLIKKYSNNHVEVKDVGIYINNRFIMNPTIGAYYSGVDRAYMLSSNLAKIYHYDNNPRFYKNAIGDICYNDSVVIHPGKTDENVDIILSRMNK